MSLNGKRVLVTGSSGFVGRHLTRALKENGARVVPFDITEGKDITRWRDFQRVGKIDLVYHLAAVTFVPQSQKKPAETYHINILGTINALECCRLKQARLVFASSYLYGNPQCLPVDEKHPLQPTNPYARSKVIGEQICRAYHEEHGVSCVILRPFNIYGQGQSREFLIPEIVSQIRTKKAVTLKDLTPKRDFLYISDAVAAYLRAGEYSKSKLDIFNIGSGQSYSVKEIAAKLVQYSGKNLAVKSLAAKRKGEISETVADIRKARRLLKWRPLVDLETGLRNILETPVP